MLNMIKNFRKDEDGAVTVDWVVLTAAVIALAGVAYSQISAGVSDISTAIGAELTGIDVDAQQD
jgi:Flp pilus assembly pilin Flp